VFLFTFVHGGNTQIGGSLMSQSKSDVVPIKSSKPIPEQQSTDNLRLEMVAPSKQALTNQKLLCVEFENK
jgi:hypothetical protein